MNGDKLSLLNRILYGIMYFNICQLIKYYKVLYTFFKNTKLYCWRVLLSFILIYHRLERLEKINFIWSQCISDLLFGEIAESEYDPFLSSQIEVIFYIK